jgi:hypothetical protein
MAMKYRKLPGTDLEVSEVCLGTMTFGEQNTEAEAHAQLDYAIAQGINVIDTAEMYPVPPNATTQGRTETFVGNWLARRGRDAPVIMTKVAGPGRRDWIRGGRTDLTRDVIAEAVETVSPGSRSIASTSIRSTGRSATSPCSARRSSIRQRKRRVRRSPSRSKGWRR